MCAKQKKPAKAKTPPPKKTSNSKETAVAYLEEPLFPVAAIGASAGGIEAISQFLAHLKPNLGIAYVIIQHLSSDHSSILPSLLAKRTSMKVHLVKDGMKIQPDGDFILQGKFEIPDLFVIDKQLSGVDGLDLCKHLKSWPPTSHLPVIILSATPHLAVQIKQVGADAFLEKPFSNNDLLQAARELTNGR